MSLLDIYKVKKLGIDAGEMFNALIGKKRRQSDSFNKWDEVWEVGSINPTTGENATNANMIRSKGFIPVAPSTKYYHLQRVQISYYDKDKEIISSLSFANASVFTTPPTAAFVRFAVSSNYGAVYKNDICINVSGDRNGEYQPYGKP